MVAVPADIAFDILPGSVPNGGFVEDKAAALGFGRTAKRQAGMHNPVDAEPFAAFGPFQKRQVVAGVKG